MTHADEGLAHDASNADDVSHMKSAASAGKWLRKAMMQPKCGGSTPTILAFLDSLEAATAAEALQQGNNNNKVPLHYASQFRPELVSDFISRGADVNVSTRRGHTPLIFAAGRGNNETVRILLKHGANPRIIVVTGDTASGMGKTRLDLETQSLLEKAEASSDLPWQDYRIDQSAQQAQRDHVKTCPHCRRKEEREKAVVEEARLRSLSSDMACALATAMMANISEGRRHLVEQIVPKIACSRDRVAIAGALRMAVSATAFSEDRVLSEGVFRICSICEDSLLRAAFHEQGCSDLRPVRLILHAVLEELESSKARWVDTISVQEIVMRADAAMALECLLMMPRHQLGDDTDTILKFCEESFATFDDLYNHTLFSIPERCLGKKEGGPVVTVLQRFFQLIGHMEDRTESCADLAIVIAKEAVKLGKFRLLQKALEALPSSPNYLLPLLENAAILLSVNNQEQVCKKHVSTVLRAPIETLAENGVEYPWYQLKVPYYWVADESSLNKVRAEIEEKLLKVEDGSKVWLAIDTEWGDDKKARHCGPSIVQMALVDCACVWILDTAVLSDPLQIFFRWIFVQQHLLFLGFAFGHDIPRLSVLLGDCVDKPNIEVLDLQKVAMNEGDRAVTPGLKSLAAACLGVRLDKSEQCSDWDMRPLTESQLKYAAADAAVLLDIASAMQVKR